MEEETNDVADNEGDLSTRVEDRATRDLIVVAIVTLNQRALGEDEVERESGQGERGEEAHPNENRVGLDHATVSDHRANKSVRRSPCQRQDDRQEKARWTGELTRKER